MGARIVAVADVFTAIMEHRPYRTGMRRDEGRKVMSELAKNGKLDAEVISILDRRFDDVLPDVLEAESKAMQAYELFAQRVNSYKAVSLGV